MRLRKREILWLAVLGGVLLVVQGMDQRTRSLRGQSRRAVQAAAAQGGAAAGGPAAGATGGTVSDPTAALGDLARPAGATGSGATLTAADLAALPWGPSPFARLATGALAAGGPGGPGGPGGAGTPATDADAIDAPPRFQGVVRVGDALLAALGGKLCREGDRTGAWRLVAFTPRTATVVNLRTRQTLTLARDPQAATP